MREFGRIETTIWQNRKFKSLSPKAQMLWLYILTCPHGNAVGCFVLPDGYIMSDLGNSFETVTQTVSELLSKGFIERDETTFLTWVRGWWGHNTIENPNVAKAAMKAIALLPRCRVLSQFLADFERFPKPLAERLRERFPNGYPNRYPNPIETKEPEPEPEPESKPDNKNHAPQKSGPAQAQLDELWGGGLTALCDNFDIEPKKARGMIGGLLKEFLAADILEQIDSAVRDRPGNVYGYLANRLKEVERERPEDPP